MSCMEKEWTPLLKNILPSELCLKLFLFSFSPHDTQPSSPSDFTSAVFLAAKILERWQVVDYETEDLFLFRIIDLSLTD